MHLPECACLRCKDSHRNRREREESGLSNTRHGQLQPARPGHIRTLTLATTFVQGELDTTNRLSCNSDLLREGVLIVVSLRDSIPICLHANNRFPGQVS